MWHKLPACKTGKCIFTNYRLHSNDSNKLWSTYERSAVLRALACQWHSQPLVVLVWLRQRFCTHVQTYITLISYNYKALIMLTMTWAPKTMNRTFAQGPGQRLTSLLYSSHGSYRQQKLFSRTFQDTLRDGVLGDEAAIPLSSARGWRSGVSSSAGSGTEPQL